MSIASEKFYRKEKKKKKKNKTTEKENEINKSKNKNYLCLKKITSTHSALSHEMNDDSTFFLLEMCSLLKSFSYLSSRSSFNSSKLVNAKLEASNFL